MSREEFGVLIRIASNLAESCSSVRRGARTPPVDDRSPLTAAAEVTSLAGPVGGCLEPGFSSEPSTAAEEDPSACSGKGEVDSRTGLGCGRGEGDFGFSDIGAGDVDFVAAVVELLALFTGGAFLPVLLGLGASCRRFALPCGN